LTFGAKTDLLSKMGVAPQYLIRDRDAAYGVNFIRRLAAMGIRKGSTELCAIALAKWTRRGDNRFSPSGLPRSCNCLRRTAPAPFAQFVSKVLQRGPHAPISAEGCADRARRPTQRPRDSGATFGRLTPPIYSNLSFRQGQRLS
jgi:hypothetical protein